MDIDRRKLLGAMACVGLTGFVGGSWTSVERTIRELAVALGIVSRPIIKWMEDPKDAFDRLSRHGLDALLGLCTTNFWHLVRRSIPFDEDAFERSFDLHRLAAELLRVEEHTAP
jgi:hypothetical protein